MSFEQAPEPGEHVTLRHEPIITSFDLVEYVLGLLTGIDEPRGELVVGLDADGFPTGIAARSDVVEHPPIDAEQLRDLADELDAVEIFVATIVAADTTLPRPGDAQRFGELDHACRQTGLLLLDHVVIALGGIRPDGIPDVTFASLWEVFVHEVSARRGDDR
jgi:hypothetical protein